MQIYCTTISVKHQQGGRERDRGDSSLSVTGGRSRHSFSPPSFCSFTMIWQKQPEAKHALYCFIVFIYKMAVICQKKRLFNWFLIVFPLERV